MFYVGADACKAGWFAVILAEESDWQVAIFPNIFSLWNHYKDARLILLDVPIGLRDSESKERSCDKEARKLLGPQRGSSVFPTPCRAAVYAETYEEASAINERMTGRRLSQQVWGIVPKIREVDQLLSSEILARSHIREIHPEVCFWALAGSRPMTHRKRAKNGFLERMEVLLRVYPHTKDVVDYASSKFLRRQVGKDDILDALAAAVTASAEGRGLSSLPKAAEFDSHGLPMEMVYHSLK